MIVNLQSQGLLLFLNLEVSKTLYAFFNKGLSVFAFLPLISSTPHHPDPPSPLLLITLILQPVP